MRKITEEAINAFYNSKPYKNGNTEVFWADHMVVKVISLKLYNTVIAKLYNNFITIQTGGFNTKKTLEILNSLKKVNVKYIKKQLYLNRQKWNGNLIEIEQ